MFSNKGNLKLLRNFCKICFRRLTDVNVVDKQKHPLIFHTDKLFAQEDIKRYNSRLPELIKSICDDHVDFKAPMERFATDLSRLLPHKMLIEGLKVLELYKDITDSKTEQGTKNAEILGWCCDILVHSMQINDDIMENIKVRWERDCYHTLEDVGMYAVNDTVLMDYFSYFLLKKFFKTKPWYRNCIDMVQEVCLKTAIGQSFEKCLCHNGELQFQNMTLPNYKNYTIYKGRYSAVQLPLMMSHFAAENYDVHLPERAKSILSELGIYLSVQNDMTDYVRVVETTRNDRSDIARGGFTWLITQALIRGSSGQKDILRKHYGVNDSDSVLKVIGVYEDLKIFDLYEQYKKKSRENVHVETERAPISRAHKNSFLKLLELLY